MTATLYVNTSDNRYLSKSISSQGSVPAVLKEDTDLMQPVIILENSAQVQQANYVYLDDFGRYYYIEDKTFSHQRMYLSLRVDVLMSFAAGINNCDCIALRSTNKYNSYLNDAKYSQLAYNRPVIHKFDNSFSKNNQFILSIAGGV